MKFEIEVTETLSRTVTAEAENVVDAIAVVESQYKCGTLVLDANDYVAVEYICPAEAKGKSYKKRCSTQANQYNQRGDRYEQAV